MRKDFAPARLRADSRGRYFSAPTASCTRARVSACTVGSLFITRETVLIETPAWRATSMIVGGAPALLFTVHPLARFSCARGLCRPGADRLVLVSLMFPF